MRILIDIDDNLYTRLFDNGIEDYEIANDDLSAMAKAIRKGVPLPKGHGRLVDADDIALIDEQFYTPSDYYIAENAIDNALTIIEADKGESEG